MPAQHDKKLTILTIPGSLRENSSTHAVINAAKAGLGGKVNFIVYDSIGNLPHFNDSKEPPESVLHFRQQLAAADGIFICTPEYAFGVPGMLKNALDWTVSSGEFVGKPTAVIVAATGGDKAFASILLTLGALSANVADDAKLLIPFVRAKLDENGVVKDAATMEAINRVMQALTGVI